MCAKFLLKFHSRIPIHLSLVTMPSMLGCAQNPNGFLKDVSQIQWQFSRSSSSVDFGITQPASLLLPLIPDMSTREPSHGKVLKDPKEHKRPIPKMRPKRIYPSKSLTGAVKPLLKRGALTLNDRLDILRYAENEGRRLSQAKIARHFHDASQNSISQLFRKSWRTRTTFSRQQSLIRHNSTSNGLER